MGDKVVPIEVKAEKNLKAKSLKVFMNLYEPKTAIRSSLSDLGHSHSTGCKLYEIPLYMIGSVQAAVNS